MGGWDSSSRWSTMSTARLRYEMGVQEFFSVPEAAKLLRYDVRTVRRMAASDESVGVMLRGRWRIRTSWLREQVSGRQGEGNAA